YAAVPVKLTNTPPVSSANPPLDYDNDGASDPVVYRASEGRYFQRRSGSGLVGIQWVAGDQFNPVQGDFDGDGITDLALVFDFFGYLAWYTHNSSDNTVNATIWGFPGDQIAIADYNGDGRDQIAVFRDGIWFVLDEAGGAYV